MWYDAIIKGCGIIELQFDHPEFEYEVRKELEIFDRPITDEDALSVLHLDLSNFDFCIEDLEELLVALEISQAEEPDAGPEVLDMRNIFVNRNSSVITGYFGELYAHIILSKIFGAKNTLKPTGNLKTI